MEVNVLQFSDYLLHAPPLVMALFVMMVLVIWQIAGASLLSAAYFSVFRLPGLWAVAFGWLTWLPVAGLIALVLSLCEALTPSVLLSLGLLITASGLSTFYRYRQEMWRSFQTLRQQTLWRWVGAALLVKLIELGFAAHSQRLYDQLNYHLVVAKKAILHGSPFAGTFDTHVLFSGLVEFAFSWAYALLPNDLFLIAFGQSWIYLSIMGAVVFAWCSVGSRAMSESKIDNTIVFALVILVYPALIPNAEIARIAKPDGLLFAATTVLLLAYGDRRVAWLPLCLGFGALFVACKLTFVHAGIGFAVLAAVRRPLWFGSLRTWVGSGVIGCLALAFFLYKNLAVGGSPLYPADSLFWPSSLADEQTVAYWRGIAFGSDDTFVGRMLGAVKVLWRHPLLVYWAAVVAVASMWYRKTLTSGGSSARHVVWFLAAYVLAWPFFYDSQIYSRFVSPYPAAVLVLVLLTLGKLPVFPRRLIALCGILVALSSSHIDVKLLKIWQGLHTDAAKAFAQQHPRYLSAQFVNRNLPKDSLVLLDDPAQLTFDMHTLYSVLSPPERSIWQNILAESSVAAARWQISALVRRRSREGRPVFPAGPIDQAWQALDALGTVQQVGDDEILSSSCFFQAYPCPSDEEWN